jgi:hypothetical protein
MNRRGTFWRFLVSTMAIISTTAKISIMAVVDILKLKKAVSFALFQEKAQC